jgi:two-component system response regulator NreC
MIRVVLVEDHLLVRSGLRHLLEARGPVRVVGEAGSCREALELLEKVQADVAILDVSLPDGTGIALCQRLRERFPELRLLALSMHEDLEYVRGFLQAGGQGYVSKAAVDQELLDAVLAVARGERYLNPALAMRLAMELVRESAEEAPLSPREEEVLRLLAQGLSHKEVAEKLGISEKTVATYRERGMGAPEKPFHNSDLGTLCCKANVRALRPRFAERASALRRPQRLDIALIPPYAGLRQHGGPGGKVPGEATRHGRPKETGSKGLGRSQTGVEGVGEGDGQGVR